MVYKHSSYLLKQLEHPPTVRVYLVLVTSMAGLYWFNLDLTSQGKINKKEMQMKVRDLTHGLDCDFDTL